TPDLSSTKYFYDAAGRLIRVELPTAAPAYYTYDASGMLTLRQLSANAVMAYMTYDVAGRLSQIDNRAADGSQLSFFGYNLNPNGQPSNTTHEAGYNSYFSYDALDRLTLDKWVAPGGPVYAYGYTYDAASNRLSKIDQ